MDTAKIFTLTGNDRPIEEIITKLKFISKIKPNEKINVRSLFVRDNNNTYQRVLRTFALVGESKDETLTFIKSVINEAVDLIYVYKADSEDVFKQDIAILLVSNLESSKTGMKSLMETYASDTLFVSKIEAVISTLDARIHSLSK